MTAVSMRVNRTQRRESATVRRNHEASRTYRKAGRNELARPIGLAPFCVPMYGTDQDGEHYRPFSMSSLTRRCVRSIRACRLLAATSRSFMHAA